MTPPALSDSKNFSLKRHRGVVLFLLVGAFIVLAGYFFWRFLEKPAVGTIHPVILPKEPEQLVVRDEIRPYTGKYVDFSYSADYFEKHHETPPSGPIQELIIFSGSGVADREFVLTVEDREGTDLFASPSVQMRSNKPKEYDKEAFSVHNVRGLLFTKKSQVYEQGAFFFKQGMLMSLVVSSPMTLDGLQDEVMKIVKSVEVKKK